MEKIHPAFKKVKIEIMNFPILNISIEKWNEQEDLTILIHFDKYIYTSKYSIFKEYYLGHLFCDCNGTIYKVVGKSEVESKWRKLLSFLPNLYKQEIYFKKTGKKLTKEELKNIMISRISEMKVDDFNKAWLKDVERSNSYFQIMTGLNK
ncbi:hypothetical protein E0K83_16045 [Gramella sp. BOM4]|nr:hypothetical protein [Christiangramia bathymodioli]